MARISDLTVNGDTHLLGKTYGTLSGRATNADKADLATNATRANVSASAETLTYQCMQTVFSRIYPVGSVYISMNNTDPGSLFGGTWKRISQGRMLLGANDTNYKLGSTGGEETHTLTAAEMPAHSHSGSTSMNGDHKHGTWGENGGNPPFGFYDGNNNHCGSKGSLDWDNAIYNTSTNGNHNHTFTTDNSGGGTAHNNMSPYLACYIWQRTA